MNKPAFSSIALTLTIAILTLGTNHTMATNAEDGIINVMDFGATGDGKTDDTAAIQAAFDAVGENMRYTKTLAGKTIPMYPEVHFPRGIYIVSDTINIRGSKIIGRAYPVIRQTDPDKDIFSWRNAHILTIDGIRFIGGKTQINLYNTNLGGGVIQIRNCHFDNSGDFATIVDVLSTTILIEKSNYMKCMQGMYLARSDMALVRDCWLWNKKEMRNKAFIVNKTMQLTMENILGNPSGNGFDQRWIDHHRGNLTLRKFRFGGEDGGYTPVVNFAKAVNIGVGSSIVIEDSWCMNTSNDKRDCVLYLEEIPNRINVEGNVVTPRHLIKLADNINPETYFVDAKVPASMTSYTMRDNVGTLISNDLPEKLVHYNAYEGDLAPAVPSSRRSELLAAAAEHWSQNRQPPIEPREWKGHTMQTDPDKYIDLTPDKSNWVVEGPMDATRLPNDHLLGLTPSGDDMLYVWLHDGKHWPHFRVTGVEVDLDKTPFLSWQEMKTDAPPGVTLRVFVPELGIAVNVGHTKWGAYKYRAFDLRKELDLTGKHTMDFQFYPEPFGWVKDKGYTGLPDSVYKPKPGTYGVFDFLRLEAE